MILGPDGRPVRSQRPQVRRYADGSVEVQTPTETHRVNPQQLLMEMARAERDGMNHAQLIAHFGLMGDARSPFVINRALAKGHELLRQAIARGEEPAERKLVVMDEIKPDPGDDIQIEYDEEKARWRPQ